jgi:lipid-A-disaccharide synthase
MAERRIMIVAGEASGDLHAAKLARAIQACDRTRQYSFFGSAGPEMRIAGVEPVVAADELSIVGLAEIAGALPMFLRARRSLLAAAKKQRPDAAVLVDFPDFNLKLARSLKMLGIPVVYYISPQVWAWRKYRLRTIRKHVDILLTILPFEEAWFRGKGLENVQYVGSPLAREVFPTRTKKEFCSFAQLDPAKPIIALLPGSRAKEIDRILPVMADAISLVHERVPDVQFTIGAASETSRDRILSMLATQSVNVVVGETYNLLYAADAAAVTSGTATMEAGIIGTPLVVVYKTSRLNYALLEPLISVEHYGLINLIAGERLASELIQNEFTPISLTDELLRLLDPAINATQREKLRATAGKLGHGGASPKAAEIIIEMMERRDVSG